MQAIYLAKREREAAAAMKKAAHNIKLCKDAEELSKSNTGKRKAADESVRSSPKSPNPRCLTVSANFRDVSQPSITTILVS